MEKSIYYGFIVKGDLHGAITYIKQFPEQTNLYLDYIYVDAMGGLIKPSFITQHFDLLLKKHDMKKIRFHDLRHPYVKHTTKNKSLQKQKSQAINRF